MVAEVRAIHKNDQGLRSKMTKNKEILPQYRDQLEMEIKDIFLWAIGQNAITEMTRTVRERERIKLTSAIQIIHIVSTLHTGSKCSRQQGQFLRPQTEDEESAADVWKRISEAEKNCEFETITAAELLASKFLSVIGKATDDYDLKKKIR